MTSGLGAMDGLRVVGLLHGGFVWQTDGIVDVVRPPVGIEPDGVLSLHCGGHIRLLVQRVSAGRERVRGLVGVVRVAIVLYKGVLIWVPVLDTGSAAPSVTYMPPRDRQTARRTGKSRAEEWIKSEDGITETMTGPNGVYTRFVSTSPPDSELDDA